MDDVEHFGVFVEQVADRAKLVCVGMSDVPGSQEGLLLYNPSHRGLSGLWFFATPSSHEGARTGSHRSDNDQSDQLLTNTRTESSYHDAVQVDAAS